MRSLDTSLRKRLRRLSKGSPALACTLIVGSPPSVRTRAPRRRPAGALKRLYARTTVATSARAPIKVAPGGYGIICRPHPLNCSGRHPLLRDGGSIEAFLCGWHLYLAVMGLLLAFSAGRSTVLGRLALVAAALSVVAALGIFRPLLNSQTMLGANFVVIAVGVLGLVVARRSDTRQIALLYAGAAALPLLLAVWSPDS